MKDCGSWKLSLDSSVPYAGASCLTTAVVFAMFNKIS